MQSALPTITRDKEVTIHGTIDNDSPGNQMMEIRPADSKKYDFAGLKVDLQNNHVFQVHDIAFEGFFGYGLRIDGNTEAIVNNCYFGLSNGGVDVYGNWGVGIEWISTGTGTISNCVISGNQVLEGYDAAGIRVIGVNGSGVTISNNKIGTNVAGNSDYGIDSLHNDVAGIHVVGRAGMNIYGNTISNNKGPGIWMSDFPTYSTGYTSTQITNNIIGLDATGNSNFFQNIGEGIRLDNTPSVIVAGNTISASVGNGITVLGTNSTWGQISGNIIGLTKNKVYLVGNYGDGIGLEDGARNQLIYNNDITGSGYNTNGVPTYLSAGIRSLDGGTGNRFSDSDYGEGGTGGAHNRIWNNVGLGIDLGTLGQNSNDTNDSDTGPNNLQNNPSSLAALYNSVTQQTAITGSINVDGPGIYELEFYTDNSTANAEGRSFFAFKTFTVVSGNVIPLNEVFSGLYVGTVLTSTVTKLTSNSRGNTSEFSPPIVVAMNSTTNTDVTVAIRAGSLLFNTVINPSGLVGAPVSVGLSVDYSGAIPKLIKTGDGVLSIPTQTIDKTKPIIFQNTHGTTYIAAELGTTTNNNWQIEVKTPAIGEVSKIVFDNPTVHTKQIATTPIVKYRTIYTQMIKKLTIEKGAVAEVKNKYYVDSTDTGFGKLSGALFVGDAASTTALIVNTGDSSYAGGTLILNNNDLVVFSNSTNLATTESNLIAAFLNWQDAVTTGPNLQSIDAAGTTGFAILNNANALMHLTNFDDVTFTTSSNYNQIIVRYSFFGDADHDGDVDLNDMGIWAQNFSGDLGATSTTVSKWLLGDFDYDGDVDLNDLGLWAQAFTGDLGQGSGSVGW